MNPIDPSGPQHRPAPARALRRLSAALMACLLWALCPSCLDDDALEADDTLVGNFEAVWTALDEHYCFFAEKGVDWRRVHDILLPYARDSIRSSVDLLSVCDAMLGVLRDGHTNLYAPFNVARYWAWFEDYDANFDQGLLDRYYLGTDYWIASGLRITMLRADSVAYMRYASFTSAIGETNVDYALAALRGARGLIIDVRDNGGGSLSYVPVLASRFATEPTVYGYIRHKTGPGHDDLSAPEPMTLEPQRDRFSWDASLQPVVVLTNRSTYSAANNFVQAMRALDGTPTPDSLGVVHPKLIKVMGDKTGGGGGMPFETVIPNGWVLRFSACPILDHEMRLTEEGIEPDIAVAMDSLSAYRDHRDDIIEAARAYIVAHSRMTYPDPDQP